MAIERPEFEAIIDSLREDIAANERKVDSLRESVNASVLSNENRMTILETHFNHKLSQSLNGYRRRNTIINVTTVVIAALAGGFTLLARLGVI